MGKEFLKGRYKPVYPNKYVGDISSIIYRSSYELRFMKFCDYNKSILNWSSEGLSIDYIGLDGKVHKYIPDFLIELVDTKGVHNKCLVEIKPFKQTIPPKKGRKRTKTIAEEQTIYQTNISKWESAKKFCNENNFKFLLITEKDLWQRT